MFELDRQLLTHKEPEERNLPPLSVKMGNGTNATIVNHVSQEWLHGQKLSASDTLDFFDAFTMRKALENHRNENNGT